MPCIPEAIAVFQKHGLLFAPGKASNGDCICVRQLATFKRLCITATLQLTSRAPVARCLCMYVRAISIRDTYPYTIQYVCVELYIYIHSYTYINIHTYIRLHDLHVYTVKTAGGVGTSGLEMSQNSQGLSWTRDEVDKELESIMKLIHRFLFFIWRLAYICV